MNDPKVRPDSCRVLVWFPNWLGDAVMASGMLDSLDRHRELPDGRRLHLTLAIRRAWAPVFLEDPRCDDFLLIERNGRHAGVGGLFHLRNEIARGGFDAVVLGPPSLRVALASALAGIPLRVGYSGDGRSGLLSPCLPAIPRGSIHYSREMQLLGEALLKQLGVSVSEPDIPLGNFLPGCDGFPSNLPAANCARWILAPGATYGQAKTWPLAQAMEFSRQALEQSGVELIILGDTGAATFASDLARGLALKPAAEPRGIPGLVDLTGRTTLPEVVALLKGAQAFVGNDSGLMHLAAALGTATLGIFGSSNIAWTAPQGPRAMALAAEGFPCQPCYRKTCNQPQFCLDTVTGAQVLANLENLLTSNPTQLGGLS